MRESILDLVGYADSVKSLHWQTSSFSEHKALGKLYDGLVDLTDSLVETYQGKYERLNVSGLVKVGEVDSVTLCNMIYLTAANIETKLAPSDTDLLNILADIKGLANHTKYLLTLK